MLHTAKRAALALLAGTITATLIATPANAQPVKPRAGEGIISMTQRTCGTASSWRAEAARNGVTAASGYLVYFGRSYDIDCSNRGTTKASRSTPRAASSKADTVIGYALAQRGDRYVWGAAGPDAWDCSGLVMKAYAQIGVKLPHQSGLMLNHGRKVSRSQLRPGDLVWPHYGHVQLYIGGGKVVEAANPSTGVVVRPLWGFWTARRIL